MTQATRLLAVLLGALASATSVVKSKPPVTLDVSGVTCLHVKTIALDSKKGIESMVRLISCSGEQRRRSGPNGEVKVMEKDFAERDDLSLVAVPESDGYLQSSRVHVARGQDCAAVIQLACPRAKVVWAEIEKAEGDKDWGRAALIAGDLKARQRAMDVKSDSEKVDERVYLNVAQKLNVSVDKALKPDSTGATRPGPELCSAIKKWKRKNKISDKDCNLDFKVLKEMAADQSDERIGSSPLYLRGGRV